MQAVATSEAEIKVVERPAGVGARHNYVGAPGLIDDKAQAFLVVRPYAGARVEPHFHDVDQFQVVVAGDGRIGKKEVRPITFQYADAFTPYGPIVGRDDGISFFTLRNVSSGGHWAMPGNKHNMPCRAGRNIEGIFDLGSVKVKAKETIREELMTPQDDGVWTVGIRMGAGATADGIVADHNGQYYLICSGSLIQDGKELPSNSLIRVDAGEAAPTLTAGSEGAEVLAMQFGKPSERPGSDPSKLASRDPNGYVERKNA